MTVLAPADPGEAKRATQAALELDGPVYLRLGKNGEPDLLGTTPFTIGQAVTLAGGGDVVLASTGPVLAQVLRAAELLSRDGVQATVLHYPTLKPFDARALIDSATRTGAVITVEEHTVIGGLGGAAAEALAEAGTGARLRRIGLRDTFAREIGSQAHLLSAHGITDERIYAHAIELLRSRPAQATPDGLRDAA
jgi:transketolase